MTTTLTILEAARQRIAVPKCWVQGSQAENRLGFEVSPAAETAVCWCASAAVEVETAAVCPHDANLIAWGDLSMDDIPPCSACRAELMLPALVALATVITGSEFSLSLISSPEAVVEGYNDWVSTTHADIIDIFDHAIEAQQENKA